MAARGASAPGFFAALDQSGGSTPRALRLYGLSESDYADSGGMFRLIHEMRVRITTAPAFTGRARAFLLGRRTINRKETGVAERGSQCVFVRFAPARAGHQRVPIGARFGEGAGQDGCPRCGAHQLSLSFVCRVPPGKSFVQSHAASRDPAQVTSHSRSLDQRRRLLPFLTAIASALRWPTSTTSRLPRVTPV